MRGLRTARLGDCCEITSSKRIHAADYTETGIPFYRGKEIIEKHRGNLAVSTELFISEAQFERIEAKFGSPLAGDLLLTSVGTLGIPYVVKEGEQFYFKDGNLTWFRNFKGLDSRYLYFWLLSDSGKSELRKCTIGSSQPALTIVLLKEMRIDLPPLPVQRQIADTLSAYDDLIENNTRRIAILEEIAQRLYREWFVHFRYPGHESVPLVESELGLVPEGWEVSSFAKLAVYVNGYAFKPMDWSSCGTPIVKIAELKNGITESTPRYSGTELPDKFQVGDGDLLFSWSADLNVYLWNGGSALLNQHLFRVDPVAGVSRVWLLQALSHSMDQFQSLSLGTTMRHIKRSALSQVRLIVPSATHISDYTSTVQPMHDELMVLARSQRVLRQTRDLLLRKLIGG